MRVPGHRRRLRERFTRSDLAGFSDQDLLELLLTFSVPRKDMKGQARGLLGEFGSLAGVLEAEGPELEKIPGVGGRSSFLLRLLRESGHRYLESRLAKKDVLRNASETVAYLRALLMGKDHEEVWVLYINAQNRILGKEPMALGGLDQAQVYPRRIVERALLKKAAGVILAHNHPSGEVRPSLDDERLTEKVRAALALVDIKLLDHLIVGHEGHFSFRRSGLLT